MYNILQSYHEEMIQKQCKLTRFNEYAPQLKQRQPLLSDEVDVFLKEVNKQWDMVEQFLTPHHQDPETLLRGKKTANQKWGSITSSFDC